MKLPSLDQALSAISALSGLGPAIAVAKPLVDLVIDVFDGSPESQDTLKAKVKETYASAGAALDEFDAAIDEAERKA